MRARGVTDLRAELSARTGMAAFAHATISWLDDPTPDLGARPDRAGRELKLIAAAGIES